MNTERVRLPRKLVVSNGVLVEEGRLHPVGPLNITLNMLPLHRVSMTLAEDDLPLVMHDSVEVFNQNGSVGMFRVTKISKKYRKQRQYELSHALDVFSDANLESIEKYSGTVAAFLQRLVNAQTQKIGGVKCWQLGTVSDTNPWNKEIKYDNVMECLTDIAKTEEDYMFTFDMSAFPWTLNFIARDNALLSEFRLSRNIENCTVDIDDTNQCTRLNLSVTDETSETVTDKNGNTHTIITTQEGYYTYDDATGQADWGPITKSQGVNRADVPTPAALQAWVDAYFSRHRNPALTITIEGEEINRLTGESIDEAHIGRLCRLALPKYTAVFDERIVSITYPDALRTPSRIKASLSNKRQTAEGSFSELKQSSRRGGGAAKAAKEKADNNEAEQEKLQIIYDLQVQKDEKRFSIIASESWYQTTEASGKTLVGIYDGQFEVTARHLTSAFSVTGVQLDVNGDPVVDQNGDYVFVGGHNSLSSQITQTASDLTSLYTKTGVNNLGQSETLYSKIAQNADSITTLVSKTGIDSLGQDETLYSEISQNASSITSLVSKTGVNNLGQSETLYSKIAQNESSITTEVTNRSNADSALSSRITQNANSISLVVSNGAVDAASIVAAVNSAGSSVKITASHIILDGQAVVNSLEGYLLDVYGIEGTFAQFDTIYVGSGEESVANAIMSFGTATESGGQITIPTVKLSGNAGPDINFNIAATQYYQDGVAAAETTGWNAARAMVEPPAQGDATSFTVKVPSATQNQQHTYTFTIQKGQTPGSTGYASVALLGVLVGRIEIGSWYDAGVTAGAAGVTLSASGWTGTPSGTNTVTASNGQSIAVTLPTFTSSQSAWTSAHKKTVTFATASVPAALKTETVDASGVYSDGYSDGWDAARGKVSWPSAGTGTTFDVSAPSATEGNTEAKTFTVQKGATPGSSGYASVALNGTVVARISIGDWYTAGETAGASGVTLDDPTWGSTTTNANNTFTVQASNDASKSQGLYLSQGSWSSGSKTVYMRTGSSSGTIRARTTVSLPGINDVTWSWTNPAQGVAQASITICGKTYSSSKQIPSGWM